MWFQYLFYFLYKHYNREQWKDQNFPLLSSIIVIAVLQMVNFLVLRDLVIFHIQKGRYVYFSNEILIVPTIFIGSNYLYFTHNKRYKEIIKKFSKLTKEENRSFRAFSLGYIILSAVFVVLMGYTVRNNIRFW